MDARRRGSPWLGHDDLPPAVIVGMASVVGLQTARILADAGVPVIGLVGDPRHFAARTRACRSVIEADVHGPGLIHALAELGPRLDRQAVLVPATDQAVLRVSEHRAELAPWYRIPMPDHATVTALADKRAFAELTESLGLPTPATRVITDRRSAARAAEELSFPVVVKPSVKSTQWRVVTSAKVCLVDQPADLLPLVDKTMHTSDALVAQEFVGGGDDQLFTCNTYFGLDHEPLITFTSRKRRQWPPGLGVASYAEPHPDPEVRDSAVELFREVRFTGLGYLEVKRDPGTGRLLLIEANVGRPTGRSAMAEACGVPLLMTMYADAAGLPLPPASARRQPAGGPNWVDLRRDTLAAWHDSRQGNLRLRDWAKDLTGPHVHAVWSGRDPLPFAHEMAQSTRKVTSRALRRLARRTTVTTDK